MKTALRHLLPLLFVLALAACGNKGPLVMPSAPAPDETPGQVGDPLDEEDEYTDDDDYGTGAARGG